jgi:hypothetical protein
MNDLINRRIDINKQIKSVRLILSDLDKELIEGKIYRKT